MKPKKEQLSAFAGNEEDRLLLASVLDKIEVCENKNIPSYTKFLTPEEQALCRTMLEYTGKRGVFFGGREDSERAVLCFLPDYLDEEYLRSQNSPITPIRACFNGINTLSHRDFLGSLMGLGLKREAVGDILVFDTYAVFFALSELVPFILQNMKSAGRASLSLEQIGFYEAPDLQQNISEKRASVMSMRLDGVVSAAFNLSRNAAAELIKAGKVSINHLPCEKVDTQVRSGDTVAARGFGKIIVEDNHTLSRRGRMSITVKKYE